MTARQHRDLIANFYIVHAHGAFGFSIAAHHVLVSLFFGQPADGFGGGGARGRAAMSLLHELCNYTVESFFRINDVAVCCMGRVEKLGKEMEGRNCGMGLGVWSVLVEAIDTLNERPKKP